LVVLLIRKIVGVGASRAVVLPNSWLEFHEAQLGAKLNEVTLEVNGELKIRPCRRGDP